MKQLTTFFLVIISVWASAQENCTFRGMILDSLDLPVFDASVSAFDEENQSAGFTFSDKEGEFRLDMPCGKKYEIEIEHIAYEPKLIRIDLDRSKRERIQLNSSKVTLKDVIAQGQVPIKVKGDTIEYNADSFKTGNEEDLEDILKKLPGIQVEDGKVYYQGKQINSIKVEGREIFGGNTKLLTKNLPADAVDKIQLNKKFKANPFANSLQDEEQPELNIVLKEDKKNLIFGNITVGGDAQEHYDLQEKLFRFSRKTDATLISDFNTFGKEVFTNEDYFQFLGGISEFSEEGGTSALRNSMSSVMFGTGEKATEMKNHIGAFHFGYEPKDRLNITAFALATDNRLNYASTTERIYSEFSQRDENINDQNIFSFISRLKIDYTVNKKSNLKYRVNFNVQEQDNLADVTSFVDDDPLPALFRKTRNDRKNSNIYQRLSYIRKVWKDDNFGIYLTHSAQKENPDLYLNSTEEPFTGFFNTTEGMDGFELNQFQELANNTFQGLAVYNHLITNLSNIRIKLGANFSAQDLATQIFDRNSLILNDFTPSEMQFDFSEIYADATYTRKIEKLKFDIGTGIHKYKTDNTGTHRSSHLNLTRLLPHFTAKYDFNTGSALNFSYEQTFEIPQIRELTEAFDINSYFSIFQGIAALRETRFHQANLSYNLFNYFKFFNLYAGITFSQKLDNIRTEGFFNELIQFSSPFNSKIPENNWSANLYTSKRLNKIYTIKLNGFASWSEFGSRNNNIELNNENEFYTATLTNNFKFKKKVELDAGLTFSNYTYRNELNESTFTYWTPFAVLAWMVNEDFLLQSDYEFNYQFADGKNLNNNHELKASLRWQPAKKTYLYLNLGNILGNDRIVTNSFNDFYTTVNTRETLGRYYTVSVRYKF